MQSEPGHIPGAHTGQQRGRADSREVAEGEGPAAPRHSHSKDQVAFPPTKRDAKRAGHAAGAIAPSSRAGAPTGMGCGLQKTWSPLFQYLSRNRNQMALPPTKRDAKRASHAAGVAVPFRKGDVPTGTGSQIAKDLESAVSIPQPQQGSAGSPARRKAMRSEQAMPPEPQRPPAKEAHQQAQGGLQKTWGPQFQSRSRSKDRLAPPPARSDAKRASHAAGATAPFSKGGAPTGAGLWRAKGPGPIVLYRFRGTEQWGFSRPAGGKSGGAGL